MRVPRTGAPGSTTRTISCGTARCDASAHDCDWDLEKKQWACVSKGAEGSQDIVRCDDSSDCAASDRCCKISGLRLCVTRAHEFCVDEFCEEKCREVCKEGGSPCPHGTTCDRAIGAQVLDDENGIEGVCRAPADRATCADQVRCPAEKPVCVASKSSEPPTCEAETSELVRAFRAVAFRCTRQGDCKAGESCMFGARSQIAFCGAWKHDSFNALVCDPGGTVPRLPSAAELQRVCRGDANCRKKLRCFPREELPWLGSLGTVPSEVSDLH